MNVRTGSILSFYEYFAEIWADREILITLILSEIRQRYAGSQFGFLWAFLNPSATVLVLWFVAEFGFRSQPVEDFPFILWLMAGMIPWFFISDSVASATGSVTGKPYLVKKIVFRVRMLPLIQIASAGIIHLFFMLVLLFAFVFYGYAPRFSWIQVLYYSFAAAVLVTGITWATSSVVVFFRDLGHIMNVMIQLGFWITPVFWSLKLVPEKYHWLFKLNPLFYITEGYRNSLIRNVWFWETPLWTAYYWAAATAVFFAGAFIFAKLRPHFADVL